MYRRRALAVVAVVGLTVPALSQEALYFAGSNMLAVSNAAAMADVYRDAYGNPGWRGQSAPPMSAAARRVLGSTNRGAGSPSSGRSVAAGRPQDAPQQRASQYGDGDSGGAAVLTSYQLTPSLARETVAGMVERLRKSNPAAADAVATQFGGHDYDRIYRSIVAPFGFHDNDAADAIAAYTLLGWLIATGAGDPSRGEAEAVRAQIAVPLAANPKLAQPAMRANLGEEIKLLFVSLHAGWQSARREGSLRQYSDGVAGLFQRQGTDLRALRLTDQGLQPR